MAVIREHLAARGLGLHCDLQNEHAIVANNIGLLLMLEYGSEAQKADWVEPLATGDGFIAFGITEPDNTAPTPRTWRRPRCATATAGASTARRPGTPASTPRRTT